jgi:hypothetical protein
VAAAPVEAPARGDLRNYAIVTGAYWADTIADGASRMLVLFFFYERGFSALEVASLFLFYEAFGIVTNLVGGYVAARLGLKVTLLAGLATQLVALGGLAVVPEAWLVVPFVMAAQALSGIAKDLTKMSSKSAVKLVAPDTSADLYKWVAVLTGSKNALKGVGFFLGGLLLTVVGFRSALLGCAGSWPSRSSPPSCSCAATWGARTPERASARCSRTPGPSTSWPPRGSSSSPPATCGSSSACPSSCGRSWAGASGGRDVPWPCGSSVRAVQAAAPRVSAPPGTEESEPNAGPHRPAFALAALRRGSRWRRGLHRAVPMTHTARNVPTRQKLQPAPRAGRRAGRRRTTRRGRRRGRSARRPGR